MIRLLNGDCLEVLAGMVPESIDACVTDPPYHLASIVKRFGTDGAAPARGNDAYGRASRGFMGKTWDGGDIAFRPETWAAVLRVLKPGAHLVAFGAPKNYHRLACAIEDAGFEIRDSLMWLFGSGFPKSHNVRQGINKAAAGFPQGGPDPRSPNHGKFKSGSSEENPDGRGFGAGAAGFMEEMGEGRGGDEGPWQGWGTALKPAYEPIILARKPLIGTVAANVLAHGTGAISVDATRVPFVDAADERESKAKNQHADFDSGPMTNAVFGKFTKDRDNYDPPGRWPANVLHDGDAGLGENARFFYCAKAGKADRAGSKHPTVKPIALMRWLCRLVTPPGGVILDPFAGTGTTGQAAREEGFAAVLIEREAEYQADIRRRLNLLPAEIEEALA